MAGYPPFQQAITKSAKQIDNPAWRQFFVRLGQLVTGAVTHIAGALANSHLVLGNGGGDIRTLSTLGTTTQVLHGNAAGDPSWSAVSLTTDVSGDLPFSSFVPATAASKLVGRGSAAGAGDFQEISLGFGLTMSGTTLSQTGFALQASYGASSGFDPADSTKYYFGLQPGFNPNSTTDSGFRVMAPVTGTVSKVYGIFLVAGTLGTTENVTVTIKNVTTATGQTVTAAAQMSAATNTFSSTTMTLAVTAGDSILVVLDTPAWATNPTSTYGFLTILFT